MKNLFIFTIIALISLQSFGQYRGVGDEYVWDVITFEEPYQYIEIDTSQQNIWQIGEPSKTFFSSDFDIQNAIVTDTLNNYPPNNYSYFDLKFGNFNHSDYGMSVFFEINHKYDTDTLKDGGYISVSYDMGETWKNIIEDDENFNYMGYKPSDLYMNENLYTQTDTLHNGEYGFSGKSEDWVSTVFYWHVYLIRNAVDFPNDTTILRFNFLSDDVDNAKEGWMIDNIKLYSVDLGGSIEDNQASKIRIYPNPINENSMIYLESIEKEISVEILDIQGKLVYHTKCFNTGKIKLKDCKLQHGLYFVRVKSPKELLGIEKLMVN